jgi:hypothetical protein
MAATSRIFPFLPSFLNSLFAQHQVIQYCSSFVRAFTENTLIDLTIEGARGSKFRRRCSPAPTR